MFFVNLSPAAKSIKQSKSENDGEDVAIVSLAPFTPNPKIFFENVTTGTSSTKILLIKNPTKQNVNLFITKCSPEERNVTYSWTETTIAPETDCSLEIRWDAIIEGGWRDTLCLEDGRRIKKDIPIVFKSILPKVKGKAKLSKNAVKTKRKTSPIKYCIKSKSPKRNKSPKWKKTYVRSPLRQNLPSIVIDTPDRRQTFIVGKENVNPIKERFKSPMRLANKSPSPLADTSNDFEDSLEMEKSPRKCIKTPTLGSALQRKLDTLEFTPCNATFSPDSCSTGEKSMLNNNCTYEKLKNLSSDTYVKGNISGETYVKGNTSSETYVKGNLSSDTYVKDVSIANVAELSPIIVEKVKKRNLTTVFTNLTNENAVSLVRRKELTMICEESSTSTTEMDSTRKRKSNTTYLISPPKRKTYDAPALANSRTLQFRHDFPKPNSKQTTNDIFVNLIRNPYMLAATNDIDPFMSIYCDVRWMEEQEVRFQKMLNLVLTPPDVIAATVDAQHVDVAKLWQTCKKMEIQTAPTKEELSSKRFNNSHLLNTLRRNAVQLIQSPEIAQVLLKCKIAVDGKKLAIRVDKDVHLDLNLQYIVMNLFLAYNPLWLRVGLETVFGQAVQLRSNTDIVGLSAFLLEHLFKDANTLRKYKTVHSEKYAAEIKRHIVKKFLMFVYFLDKAKQSKLIPYDPCLFRKNAEYKQSIDVLLKFSSELLSSVGSITKFLRLMNYVVTFQQTYIHEFHYAVENLGVDLRDGVRLAKVMEIILLRNDLTNLLRVPAISRLQKIHNMRIVFDSLANANYQILHDIEPKDIVDGHREKTLSFLWQVIYKFQGPQLLKAVRSVQLWWRSLAIVIKRKKLKRIRARREEAARCIQLWYRRHKFSCKLSSVAILLRNYAIQMKRERSALLIQSYYRMTLRRREFLLKLHSTLVIQRAIRFWLNKKGFQRRQQAAILLQASIKCFIARKRFLQLKNAAICIEAYYISYTSMKAQRYHFIEIKLSAIIIQNGWRAFKLAKAQRNAFLALKNAAVRIQQWYKSIRLMRIQKSIYDGLRQAAIVIQNAFRSFIVQADYKRTLEAILYIQQSFRSYKLMRRQRYDYLAMKKSVVFMQRRFRANRLMRRERFTFCQLKAAAVVIQRGWRALNAMRIQYTYYQQLRKSTLFVQQHFRGNQLMKQQRDEFVLLRRFSIKLQANYKCKIQRTKYLTLKQATISMQRRFIANQLMHKEMVSYKQLKESVIIIQRRFRGNQLMKQQRHDFLLLRTFSIKLQANFKCKIQRTKYLALKQATISMQRRFRANQLMHEEFAYYQQLKEAAIIIQRRFRGNQLMKQQRHDFLLLRTVSIKLQANFKCKIERTKYLALKQATISMQRRFRANQLMHKEMVSYNQLKEAAILIQRRFRGNQLMKQQRHDFQLLRTFSIKLQANFKCKIQRTQYLALKQATTLMQRRFRANQLMNEQMVSYNQLKESVIIIQRRFRGNQMMKQQRHDFLLLRTVSIKLQANFKCKIQRTKYLALKQATISMQRRFRANQLMHEQFAYYEQLKEAAIVIQERFRATKLMQTKRIEYLQVRACAIKMQACYKCIVQRRAFLRLRKAAITIQTYYRSKRMMEVQRTNYLQVKNACEVIQTRFRAQRAMLVARYRFLIQRQAAILIQRHYRAFKLMSQQRDEYTVLKCKVLYVQRLFRAKRAMQLQRNTFFALRTATIVLQRRYRAAIQMRAVRANYLALKRAVCVTQQRYRSVQLMRFHYEQYNAMKLTAVLLQRRFRANKLMELQRNSYNNMRNATILLQRHFRANLLMNMQRNYYVRLRNAVRLIENKYVAIRLRRKVRNDYLLMREAALRLQQWFRAARLMKEERVAYVTYRECVVYVQRSFRANCLMRKQRNAFVTMREATIRIQSHYRLYRQRCLLKQRSEFAVKLQTVVRGYLIRKRYADEEIIAYLKMLRKRRASAEKIQAVWRGYKCRKQVGAKFVKIRARALVAQQSVTYEKTLSYRLSECLKILRKIDSFSMCTILKALNDLLYYITNIKGDCERLAKELTPLLFTLLKITARSFFDSQVCNVSSEILITLCKYKPTARYVLLPSAVDDLIMSMSRWCDKEGALFPNLCTLLWLMMHDKECKESAKLMPNVQHYITKMCDLCDRKSKMVARHNQMKRSVFVITEPLCVPSLEPQWGFDNAKRPKCFQYSLHAIKEVCRLFNFKKVRF